MNPALQPFVTVALPIMVTIVLATWTNNGRTAELSDRLNDFRNDMNRRLDEMRDDTTRRLDEMRQDVNRLREEVVAHLERIERKLDNHEERIVRLEERTSPIHR